MRRPSQPEMSSANSALHPMLEQVLDNLDIEIEEELVRYRRMRGQRPTRPTRQRLEYDRSTPPDLLTATMTAGIAGAGMVGALPTDTPPPLPTSATGTAIPPLAIAPNQPSAIPFEPSEDAIAPDPAPPVPVAPNDYLESSEELVRSLTEPEAEAEALTEPEPQLLQTLLTPLGIGSMLLLLVSSVTFGILLTNPGSLSLLNPAQWSGQSEEGAIADRPDSPETLDETVPLEPDLSSQEFQDLDLGTLSTLPPNEGNLPTPLSSPTPLTEDSEDAPTSLETEAIPVAPPATAPASRAAAPSPSPAPAPRASAPSPSPAPRVASPSPAPAPAPAPAPSVAATPTSPPQDLYYVVADYSGDRSLDTARQVVGDAYVRNFPNGARVQLGAFSDRAGAEALRQELSRQGISTQIYQP